MREKPRLRKREIAAAIAAGGLAAGTAGLILSDNDSSGVRVAVEEQVDEKTYQLTAFDRISTTGPQDVEIVIGDTPSVRAEGALSRMEVVVENGELIIRPRENGGWAWSDFDSTTVYVTVPRLTRVSLTGTGDVSIENLKGPHFEGLIEGFAGDFEINGMDVEEAEFTINGAGSIAAAGTARATRVTINGVGELEGGDLQSQTAVVLVRGPGEVELAVAQEADVTVEGPGEVDIDGPARCTVSTAGPGNVSCGDQD